jgi:uncharacterized membrane protein YeaQ/YmgE (transglycosylase-associated protein family)
MKWLAALLLGAIIGFLVPMMFGGEAGFWLHGWTKHGTIHPLAGSPGLLFSIPLGVGSALAFRLFFNWHSR